MAIQIQFRRGTAAEWTAASPSPVLALGEVGFEVDTGKFKIGDGTSAWTALDYAVTDGQDGQDGALPIGLPDWPVTLAYTSGDLTSAVYAKGTERYRQTLGYTDGVLTSVVYAYSDDSGSTYGNIGTETLNYTDGTLTSTSWAAA